MDVSCSDHSSTSSLREHEVNISSFFDLPGAFRRHFRVVPAFTPELRDACFRIRHAVYCEEFGFEPVRSDHRETDCWDTNSIHCLVQSVASGEFLGCMRLVMPPAEAPDTPLPFERICAVSIDRAEVDPRHLPRGTIAEASRLALIPALRRRPEAGASPDEPALWSANSGVVPCVQVGLYLGMLAVARLHGIEKLFMLVEPRLARQLGMLVGMRPRLIGSPVEHRGTRVPAMVNVPEVLDDPRLKVRPLFDEIWTRVAAGFSFSGPTEVLAEAA